MGASELFQRVAAIEPGKAAKAVEADGSGCLRG
jgi:hypothetical protein